MVLTLYRYSVLCTKQYLRNSLVRARVILINIACLLCYIPHHLKVLTCLFRRLNPFQPFWPLPGILDSSLSWGFLSLLNVANCCTCCLVALPRWLTSLTRWLADSPICSLSQALQGQAALARQQSVNMTSHNAHLFPGDENLFTALGLIQNSIGSQISFRGLSHPQVRKHPKYQSTKASKYRLQSIKAPKHQSTKLSNHQSIKAPPHHAHADWFTPLISWSKFESHETVVNMTTHQSQASRSR